MSHLLVIGGTGFFGKSILDCYLRGMLAPWGVNQLTLLSRQGILPDLLAQPAAVAGVNILYDDVSFAETVPYADYVIHAATSSNALAYKLNKSAELLNMIRATENYCHLASKYHKNSKILYISSGAVYGPRLSKYGPINELESLITSRHAFQAQQDKDFYAINKCLCESLVMDAARSSGLHLSIARCFAFIGPWLPRDQHFAVGNFLDDGLKKREIQVNSTSPVYRSYMHADDLVAWLMTMVTAAGKACEVYNVGSDCSYSLLDVAKMIGDIFNVSVNYNEQVNGVVDYYVPCVNKANRDLGLKIKYDLKMSLMDTIRRIGEHNLTFVR